MKEQNLSSIRPDVLFLSWFGLGRMPVAPGTWGTLGSIPLIILLLWLQTPLIIFSLIIFLFTLVAIYLAQKVQIEFDIHDPQWIVVDEVIGMMITWCFVYDSNIYWMILAFLLFRFFDIVKIWPANYFDRLSHGAGTILDDVISGLYAGVSVKICAITFSYLLTNSVK
jgi:phosphatidylglycerophosphatase A